MAKYLLSAAAFIVSARRGFVLDIQRERYTDNFKKAQVFDTVADVEDKCKKLRGAYTLIEVVRVTKVKASGKESYIRMTL